MSAPGIPTLPPESGDESIEHRRLRSSIADKLFGGETRQTRLGRFVLLGVLGEGGMGMVYRAYDPTLDRAVAVKLLRDGGSPKLLREAKAMARLSHPHVVAVHEVGEHEGMAFVAMELVSGGTLSRFSRERPPGTPGRIEDLVDLMLQCARGLAAAHAAGIIHRDIKPQNILLTEDGRAKLADFGLAHAPKPESGADAGELKTATGGTPAYMSPEQFAGETDERSDQFSFCVTFFETLHGRRPYAGQGLDDLARAVKLGERAKVALAPDVPAWLDAILDRGLRPKPEDRFPSISALAEAIERGRRRNTRLAVGFAVAAAVLGLGGYAAFGEPQAVCEGSEDQLAGVWDRERAASIEAQYSGAPLGDAALDVLEVHLDAYRDVWIDSHRAVCSAAHVRHEVSNEVADLQMACLQDRKRHFAALVDVVAAGDRSTFANADLAVLSLPQVDKCRDVDYVQRQGYDGGSEESDQIADRLAEASALRASGDRLAALTAAERALEHATSVGDAPGIARVRLLLGSICLGLDDAEAGRDHLVEAYGQARKLGLADVAAEATLMLVRVTTTDMGLVEEAAWWRRLAEIEQAQSGDPELRGRLEIAGALVANAKGDREGVIGGVESALRVLRESVPATNWRYLQAQREAGYLFLLNGEPTRGRQELDASAAVTRNVFGPDHPENANVERLLALADRLDGNLASAVEHDRRAIELTENALGPRHVRLAAYLDGLAASLSMTGANDEALATIDRALALDEPRPVSDRILPELYARRSEILRQAARPDLEGALEASRRAYRLAREALGVRNRDTVRYRVVLGYVLVRSGRVAEGTKEIEAALAVGESIFGEAHAEVGLLQERLASAYDAQGKRELAVVHYRRAIAVMEAAYGPDSFQLASVWANLCGALVGLEREPEALEPCRRAVALAQQGDDAELNLAGSRINLAGALMGTGALAEAKRELEAAQSLYRRVLHEDSLEESIAIANLGEVAELEGDCVRARKHYAKALEIRVSELGSDDAATAHIRERLSGCRPP